MYNYYTSHWGSSLRATTRSLDRFDVKNKSQKHQTDTKEEVVTKDVCLKSPQYCPMITNKHYCQNNCST